MDFIGGSRNSIGRGSMEWGEGHQRPLMECLGSFLYISQTLGRGIGSLLSPLDPPHQFAVHPLVRPSIYPPTRLSIHPPVYLSTHPSIYPSSRPLFSLLTRRSFSLPIPPTIHPFICLSVYTLFYSPIFHSLRHPFIHPLIYPSIYPTMQVCGCI